MYLLLKPILTRTFLFLFLLGITSSIVTVPQVKGAHMYENAVWELIPDVYFISAILCLIPQYLKSRKCRFPLRTIVKALLYAFLYPLYIIDTFCFVKFGATLNPSMLLLMGETTGNEASEFLTSYVTPDVIFSEVGIIMLVPLLHVITILATRYYHKRKTGAVGSSSNYAMNGVDKSVFDILRRRSPFAFAVAFLSNLLVIYGVGYCVNLTYNNKVMFRDVMSLETIGEVEHHFAANPHTELYQPPMRLAFSLYSNHLISLQLDRLRKTTENVVVDSCSVKSPEIVLIIGESFNKRHAQIYGYTKPNMPNQMRMEKDGDLIKMDDVVAPWNLTSFVFKHLMTTYCYGDEGDWCDYPLFCQLFRKAGYNVTFLTNQFQTKAKEAVYDFSGGFFINDEQLSKAQFDVRNDELHVFDEGLLEDYDKLFALDSVALPTAQPHNRPTAQPQNRPTTQPQNRPTAKPQNRPTAKPHLTIFHLMGMHVNYRIRCPNSKKKWGAGDYPDDMDLTEKRRKTLADFDNAVWYNDSVVNQIVERYKEKEAIVIYFSDHGEEVFGPGARHFFGRMHKSDITKRLADEEFRIPMWFYTTKTYQQNHPDVVQAIRAAKGKPYMTDAMSHLLLGLAGIHCRYYREDYDLLSPRYDAKRKRILKHQVDYDTLK